MFVSNSGRVFLPPSPVVFSLNVPSPVAGDERGPNCSRRAGKDHCRQSRDIPRASLSLGTPTDTSLSFPGGGELCSLCSPTHSPVCTGSDSGLLSPLCHSPASLTTAGAGETFGCLWHVLPERCLNTRNCCRRVPWILQNLFFFLYIFFQPAPQEPIPGHCRELVAFPRSVFC